MPLPKYFIIFSASQNAYWDGVNYTPNAEEAKEYTTKNLAETDIENVCFAGGLHKAEEYIKRPYASLAKKL